MRETLHQTQFVRHLTSDWFLPAPINPKPPVAVTADASSAVAAKAIGAEMIGKLMPRIKD